MVSNYLTVEAVTDGITSRDEMIGVYLRQESQAVMCGRRQASRASQVVVQKLAG